ncbi:MAG: glycosyltransferase family 10 [Patescibacteria group bacterium]|nr:glycosyltransferase family 10 [Patescibacteria group bacterium]
MNFILAICVDIQAFYKNKILDGNYARQFPWAGWASEFLPLAKKRDVDVATGDIALEMVHAGKWKAKDIFVISELDASQAKELIGLGARPFILSAFESPLIAYNFYDKLKDLSVKFPYRLLFPGAFGLAAGDGKNIRAYFPNFDPSEIKRPVAWDKRKFICMVAANKFWREKFVFPLYLSPLRYAKWLAFQREKVTSPTRRYAIKNELQSKRFEAIEYFGKRKELDLFGYGWKDKERLPDGFRERLDPILDKIKPNSCKDKNRTISGYKYAVCFENTAYPGYITEKIIDCFTAGVIPVYLGAPDVEKYIPPETFVDMRKFDSWEKLERKLKHINEQEAKRMIEAGREFLKSNEGLKYSFSGFAKDIDDLVQKEINNL